MGCGFPHESSDIDDKSNKKNDEESIKPESDGKEESEGSSEEEKETEEEKKENEEQSDKNGVKNDEKKINEDDKNAKEMMNKMKEKAKNRKNFLNKMKDNNYLKYLEDEDDKSSDKNKNHKKNKKKENEEEYDKDIDFSKMTLKERIHYEYKRYKYYLDDNELDVFAKIKKSTSKIKYLKYKDSKRLHKSEITSICSLTGKIKKICYATASFDKSIKFWDASFENIFNITNLLSPPVYICCFDTTYLLSAEAIVIKMYDLISENIDCVHKFKDHIYDINCILPISFINNQEESHFFSGGKDKTLRLWYPDSPTPIKFYVGHDDEVTHIQKIIDQRIISSSIDKKFLIWDINQTNPIIILNNYFNSLCVLGINCGFCVGAYDNKIRFYDDEFLLFNCLVIDFYGITNILLIDDNKILSVDIENKINVINIENEELSFNYKENKFEIVNIIKSVNFENNKEKKMIIITGKDGFVYLYEWKGENSSSKHDKKHDKKHHDKHDKSKDKEKSRNSKDKKKDKNSKDEKHHHK